MDWAVTRLARPKVLSQSEVILTGSGSERARMDIKRAPTLVLSNAVLGLSSRTVKSLHCNPSQHNIRSELHFPI